PPAAATPGIPPRRWGCPFPTAGMTTTPGTPRPPTPTPPGLCPPPLSSSPRRRRPTAPPPPATPRRVRPASRPAPAPPTAPDVALPGQSPERPDVRYDGDPLLCRTDGIGDCKIEVPPCGETDPSRCPLKPGAGGLTPAGYQVEVFVGPTSGAVLRREAGEGEG